VTEWGDLHHGVVTEFDEARGLGVVTDDQGGGYVFHCTQIADGSRRIDEGAPTSFVVVPGHLGRLEARRLTVQHEASG
jgi:cold shock CspA family protein